MPVTFIGNGTRSSDAGSAAVTPALPNRNAGDLLIALVMCEGSANHAWPAGWTNVAERRVGSTLTMSWGWRVSNASDAAPNVTWTGAGSLANFGQVVNYRGAHPLSAIGNVSVSGSTGSPHAVAGVTISERDVRIVYLGGATTNTAYGAVSGFAEDLDVGSNTGSTRNVVGGRNYANSSGATTDTVSITGSTGSWALWVQEIVAAKNVGSVSGTLGTATLAAQGSAQAGSSNGSLAKTLDAATATGAGKTAIAGAATATLAAATATAAGGVRIAGSLSSTLVAATVSATGATALGGALASTLGAATLAATATAADSTASNGALASTLGAATAAAAGGMALSGAASGTLAAASLAATATAEGGQIAATLAATLGAVTASGSAALVNSGSFNVTTGAATLAAQSPASLSGELVVTLAAATASGVARLIITGSGSANLGGSGGVARRRSRALGFGGIRRAA